MTRRHGSDRMRERWMDAPTLQFCGDVHFHARVCGPFQEALLSGWLVGRIGTYFRKAQGLSV